MSNKVNTKKLTKLTVYILSGIMIVLLIGIVSGIIRSSLQGSSDVTQDSSVILENDNYTIIQQTKITLAEKKQDYLNCIKSADIINSYELINEIYSTSSITFESHHPTVIQPVIENLTNQKCGDTVAKYEATLDEYIQASNEKNEGSAGYFPKSLEFEKITLSNEAREHGEYIISVEEVIKNLL